MFHDCLLVMLFERENRVKSLFLYARLNVRELYCCQYRSHAAKYKGMNEKKRFLSGMEKDQASE